MNIEKLSLQSYSLNEQFQFYVETLGFELIEKSEVMFSIRVGKSTLVFEKSLSKCYYHFAFNVPPFQIMEASDWAKDRVTFLEYEGNALIDFMNWNAKAFYFFDADNNIVEFIDRRNLGDKMENAFTVDSILEISEVGLPVNNVLQAFKKLNLQTSIEKYSGDYEKFCVAGDEHGLFIIVDQKDKKWLPTELPAKAFPFQLEFFNDEKKYFLRYDGEEIIIKNWLED